MTKEARAVEMLWFTRGTLVASLLNEPLQLRVWQFHDAPAYLRELSENGGDEDWLMLIPPGYPHDIRWAEEGWNSPFGVCDISHHELPNGWSVRCWQLKQSACAWLIP